MHPSKQLGLGKNVRRVLGLSRIVCTLDPGHDENHFCQTATCTYQWWNEEDNPTNRQMETFYRKAKGKRP